MTDDSLSALWVCFIVALASSSLSLTLTQTELFAPWRKFAQKLGPMMGHLAQCFYCTSHWAVFAGIALYRPVLIQSGYGLADLFVSAFVTVAMTTLISGLIFQAFLQAMRVHQMKEKMTKHEGQA